MIIGKWLRPKRSALSSIPEKIGILFKTNGRLHMTREYHVRRGADSYGFAVGILLIDTRTPFIAGDVGNASTYKYPVLFRTVPEASVERVMEQEDETLVDGIVRKARELEHMGVRAITSDCGFMLRFQEQVAEAVNVPVILSSLLQLPLLERSLARKQKIGVITANGKRLTDDLLRLSGLQDNSRVVVQGMEAQPFFRGPILDESGILVPEEIEGEVVAVAREMLQNHPEIGPILLECSSLPPYAHAVQIATGRPVFDFITMIDLFSGAAFRTSFQGFF